MVTRGSDNGPGSLYRAKPEVDYARGVPPGVDEPGVDEPGVTEPPRDAMIARRGPLHGRGPRQRPPPDARRA
ncbi:hypothetical protein ACFWMJ_08580 [Streptomyces hawaiiensis]|uniref:hypothetical protein n=1 Tax=Streptomyces hawaiiensis TaxID=67305 RepID=UPI00366242FD